MTTERTPTMSFAVVVALGVAVGAASSAAAHEVARSTALGAIVARRARR